MNVLSAITSLPPAEWALDEVRRLQRSRPLVRGFHGDQVYQALMLELIRTFQATRFIETGTNLGDSTRFIAEAYPHIEVLTCELSPRLANRARRRLRHLPNVKLANASSETFLARHLEATGPDTTEIFFLDAHWYDAWPLQKELRAISQDPRNAVVVIDDFFIPGQERFGYDEYPPGDVDAGDAQSRRCDADLVRAALRDTHPWTMALPDYSEEEAFPKGRKPLLRGHAVLFRGADFGSLSRRLRHLYRDRTDLLRSAPNEC